MISVSVTGLDETLGRFQRALTLIPGETSRRTIAAGNRLKAAIQAGSPVDTGAYRGAWQMAVTGPWAVQVSNAMPYGPRLEFGFHGTDSLGRSYSQGARPHVRPAVEAVVPSWQDDLASMVF